MVNNVQKYIGIEIIKRSHSQKWTAYTMGRK